MARALEFLPPTQMASFDQSRTDRRHRAAGHDGRTFADVGHQVVVDPGRLGMLDDYGDVGLAAAVDLAAGGRQVHAVGHFLVLELVVELVHHRLDDARGVGAGDVAVQPALGVGHHRHRVAGAADREALGLQLVDQRRDLGFVGDHELDVGADGEADMALGVLVGDVAELADRPHVHLPLRAGAHRPHLVAAMGDVVQDTGTRPIVVFPVAVVLQQSGMQVLLVVRYAALDRLAQLRLVHVSLRYCRYASRVLGACRDAAGPGRRRRRASIRPRFSWR